MTQLSFIKKIFIALIIIAIITVGIYLYFTMKKIQTGTGSQENLLPLFENEDQDITSGLPRNIPNPEENEIPEGFFEE
ncbi:MAG: hypothetical protein HYV52_01660 [Parcubacteria group bacterium]|nr:hypothetical protein [Parcubacteria group bacterium]